MFWSSTKNGELMLFQVSQRHVIDAEICSVLSVDRNFGLGNDDTATRYVLAKFDVIFTTLLLALPRMAMKGSVVEERTAGRFVNEMKITRLSTSKQIPAREVTPPRR